MSIYNNTDKSEVLENETCPSTGYQAATVCVPITVTPFARSNGTVTHCCGTPIVTTGAVTCTGVLNGSCSFTISQDICVEVPVEFGARASVGRPSVTCGEASEEFCADCDEDLSISTCKNCKKTN